MSWELRRLVTPGSTAARMATESQAKSATVEGRRGVDGGHVSIKRLMAAVSLGYLLACPRRASVAHGLQREC